MAPIPFPVRAALRAVGPAQDATEEAWLSALSIGTAALGEV